jgi:dCMP deaminase
MASETHSKMLNIYTRFVMDLKEISKCKEGHVAAIAVSADMQQVYSIGVNGGPRGGPDCLCGYDNSKYSCIHAEANCIAKCNTVDRQKVMICSYSPCVTCASLIINSGFSQVYYIKEYKDTTGLKLLRNAGITVTRLFIVESSEGIQVVKEVT